MKTLLGLLLLTGCAFAQVPSKAIRRDFLPDVFPPDMMPNTHPKNSFYQYHTDPKNVMRATVDHMPVKVPDSSTHYTMLRSFQKYVKPEESPTPFLKPLPRVIPKKFR